ncbi:MAG: hypothetical protein ACXWRA_16450, partial [Pseudobdellovibrionaceae bacterium]
MKNSEEVSSERLDSQIVFSADLSEKTPFVEKDLIRLKPYGLSVSTDFARPFLLLKDDNHNYT